MITNTKFNTLHDVEKLETFYKRIVSLTSNHDVIHDYACVTVDKLGEALEKVDLQWYEGIPTPSKEDMDKQVNVP